ncbi:DUF924 family protein [Desertibaculum subflavum]|uniref:DUF924 family protein n=1 Tax=Desertibaculum subflavum TaxID=2268458 RepID=UPI000E67436E
MPLDPSVIDPERVLAFWFPPGLDDDAEAHGRWFHWAFRGGAEAEIRAHFLPVLAAAERGDLDGWAAAPRARLALILVLDQFPRTIWAGSARAYSLDAKAVALAVEGLANGHYDRLASVWEKTFFQLPLGHSEDPVLLARCVALCEALVDTAPAPLRPIYVFSASQARAHREVIHRFGRHPHRNELLGRISTQDELAYIATGAFPHRHAFPL